MNRFAIAMLGVSVGFVFGCPFQTDNPAAVLEGNWSVTPATPGDFEGYQYEATFDQDGQLTQLSADGPAGQTATLDTAGSETTVSGDDVTITIPRLTGESVFEGTLSEDQNTMTGSLTQEIDLGNLEILLPGGDVTLERIE